MLSDVNSFLFIVFLCTLSLLVPFLMRFFLFICSILLYSRGSFTCLRVKYRIPYIHLHCSLRKYGRLKKVEMFISSYQCTWANSRLLQIWSSAASLQPVNQNINIYGDSLKRIRLIFSLETLRYTCTCCIVLLRSMNWLTYSEDLYK